MEKRIKQSRKSTGVVPGNDQGWTDERLDWADPSNQERLRCRTPSQGARTLRGAGRVTGHLIGGCADVLEMLKGTPWWPPLPYWDGGVLFYETSEDAPSETTVLRWLRNFGAPGILSRLNGILLARAGGMDAVRRQAQYAAVLTALDEVGLYELPVLANLDFGHTDPIITLPYGCLAQIDCQTATLSILEAGVRD